MIDTAWRPFEPSREAVEDARASVRDLSASIERIRDVLARYTFTPQREADLQAQVSDALASVMVVDREVIAKRGRYDILVRHNGWRIVLELKLAASAPAVERQAQRYALSDGIDAVVVVTTSNRLARELERPGEALGVETLGGKPFAVIALRGF